MTETQGTDLHPEEDPKDPGPIPVDPGPHPDDPGPIAHIKLLAGPGIKLRVAIVGGLILVIGALLAPEPAQTALSTPQERAAPLLEEQVQHRDVVRPFIGVQDVAVGVRQDVVAIPNRPPTSVRPLRDFRSAGDGFHEEGFAVIVSETQLLTHASALGRRLAGQVSTADGAVIGVRVSAYEPATGLVLLQAESVVGRPITLAGSAPVTGMLAVAAAWHGNVELKVPVFVTSVGADGYEIGAPGSVRPGMPLYDLSGGLFGIATVDGRAYPVQPVVTRLTAIAAAGGGPTSFGLAFQDLTPSLAAAFGAEGALLNDVVPAGPADRAGLLPGDSLLTVDTVDVTSAESAFRSLLAVAPGTSATLRVRRNGRVRTVEVSPATAFEVDALAQVRLDGGGQAPAALALFPATRLEASGIPVAARVVSVNGRFVTTPEQAEAAVRRGGAPVLLLRHNGDRFFAALEASK